jgi:mannose-6-phosphate isomerase
MQVSEKPYYEERPWGNFITFATNEASTVKILTVEKGQAFSLQSHEKREEEWYIISGVGNIIIGDSTQPIVLKETYTIPRNTLHRIEAGAEAVVLLEVSRGEFDEDDITRVNDRYGRV